MIGSRQVLPRGFMRFWKTDRVWIGKEESGDGISGARAPQRRSCARFSGDSTDCWEWSHLGRVGKGEAGERWKSHLGKDLNLGA